MSFQTDFGDAVRAARKRSGWSQTELAQRCGVHLNTVSQVERGSADPRLSTLQALAAALGLSLWVDAVNMPFLGSTVMHSDAASPSSDLPAFLQKQPE
jgi:transcriptional regulator with XRE-family HTH domain